MIISFLYEFIIDIIFYYISITINYINNCKQICITVYSKKNSIWFFLSKSCWLNFSNLIILLIISLISYVKYINKKMESNFIILYIFLKEYHVVSKSHVPFLSRLLLKNNLDISCHFKYRFGRVISSTCVPTKSKCIMSRG